MLASVARIAVLSLASTGAGVLAGAMKPTGPTALEARESRFGHCRDAGEIGVALVDGDGDHLDLFLRHPVPAEREPALQAGWLKPLLAAACLKCFCRASRPI